MQEIKINIFKYVDYPLNLALTCKSWSAIAKDPYVKSEWLIEHHGKARALFNAVRLGPTFIDIPVCQALIARKVKISRYFIQGLLIYFGKYNQKFLELKIEHTVGQLDADRVRLVTTEQNCAELQSHDLVLGHAFQQRIKSTWASNFPIFLFTYLLDEGYSQLTDLPPKGDNTKSFYFLHTGPHIVNYAPGMLKKNLNSIGDLILNKRFTPFPSRPKPLRLDLNNNSYIHQQQEDLYLSPLVPTHFTNNVGIFGARSSRSVIQRRRQRQNQLRRQRNILNRIYRRHNTSINNQVTLNRIANLPQQVTNNPLIDQLFNGSSFI